MSGFYQKEMEDVVKFQELLYKTVIVKDDKGLIFMIFRNKLNLRWVILIQRNGEKKRLKFPCFYHFEMLLKHYDRVYKKQQNVFAGLGGVFNYFC